MPKLTQIHVRRVISTMQEKSLSPTYIRQAHGVLSVSFNAAVDAGLLKANPAKGVKTPRIVTQKFTIVDRDKIQDFISAAKEDVNGNAMIFLLMTGLRAAEERGLKWDDIDLVAGTMEIERQLPCKGTPAFTAPKDGSTRTIELPPEAVELLRQQKKAQAEQRLAAGDKWISNPIVDGLVFRSARGWFLSESVLHKAVRAVGVKIGLPDLHPHDLRHSYAVAALRSGIDVKTVQNNLGHKNAAMTLDTYAGYTSDAGKMGAKKFSEYWQNALKKS
jgi:integrase